MNSKLNDGGPAYPGQEITQMYANEPLSKGMSLRDYFAGQAIQAFLSNSDFCNCVNIDNVNYTPDQAAYKIADAMLKAREAE